ncbi:replication protein A 70 kDa DNA-binding subunit B-like [Salvia miltiorrhiza]|uniref:replication protein A 70 kDa DNA-binding subunit B-like n=1 Tax=Salvia miltiorrhiza TaxID=226208 RepID=UPI0025AC1E67|nr:replication protein A 70 kDa DNA-binding subunit B-like [Salvia miltiorrhiza]
MEERLIPMNEILPGMKEWKCKVRVIKKLGAKQANNNPNKFQKLILGDGLGHTLDAVIFHDNIDRFKHVLQEGNVYMVKGAYVSDPKQYRNPIVTCNYQWTFRKDTSVKEEPNDSIPVGGLSFRTTPSYTACVIIATHEPRVVTVKGQGKVIREYAAIDTELESFVVTFWEDSVSDEIYAKLEPISNRIPLLLLNFSVVPYYGLSLTTNAQSIVLDGFENEMLIELERWKQENEEAINILIQTGGFFEKKVLRSPKQPLQITKVEQMLQNQENTYFNVKVKARLENEYQDYFYIGCPICSTKTVASYGTEFMCYSTPCKNMRIANRRC